jgi:outer membrane protein assembly factor BamB
MTIMRSVLSALTAAAVLVGPVAAPAAAAPADGWAQDGYGPGNTGWNPHERTITPKTAGALTYRWSIVSPAVRASCLAQWSPVVADGRMFLPDANGFAAYDAETGRRLWRHTVDSTADEETPELSVAGDTLIAAADTCGSTSDPDGYLTAYDAATGDERWRLHRDAPVYQVVVVGDVVLAGGGDAGVDTVAAYRLGDGRPLWTRDGVELGAGAAAGNLVLLTHTDGSATEAVHLRTGEAAWRKPVEWSMLAADRDGRRFLATTPGGDLLAVHARTGAIAWITPNAAGQLAVDDTRVYVAHGEDLLALNLTDGRPAWKHEVWSPVARPVVAGGVVFAGSDLQSMTMLDARTGRTVEDTPIIRRSVGHVVVVDGRLYVTDGRVLDMFR